VTTANGATTGQLLATTDAVVVVGLGDCRIVAMPTFQARGLTLANFGERSWPPGWGSCRGPMARKLRRSAGRVGSPREPERRRTRLGNRRTREARSTDPLSASPTPSAVCFAEPPGAAGTLAFELETQAGLVLAVWLAARGAELRARADRRSADRRGAQGARRAWRGRRCASPQRCDRRRWRGSA
jgi:hypothetical protein